AINPGNSGGALVDLSGRLVGINTAIFSRSGGSVGIGFAIPTSMVQLVARQAAAGGGQVQRPYFGADLQEITSDLAAGLGLDRPRGVMVLNVDPQGPAAAAGVQRGDVIISIDGTEIFDPNGFEYRFATRGIDGTARIGILRGARNLEAQVALAPPPETVPRDEIVIEGRSPFTGVRVVNLSPAVAEELGVRASDGVVITGILRGSIAERVGFRAGDIIRSINDMTVRSTRDLEQIAGQRLRIWRLLFERGGQVRQAVVRG
ncbi:MAG: PDZ domain-containing protein, partial [Hyphomicrobiaceae bacterium]|nr:PDZ domain-containing protein [Hyphomicrobiaceae bacterium]